MKINLKQLESFIWVADLGSFRRAAERLNTTQPNISSRISSLEQALVTTLMERDAGSVSLTNKGQALLAKARHVVDAAERFIDAAQANELLEGSIRLGVTEMVAHSWLSDFLQEFKRQYPNVLLELTVDLAVNLEKELHDASFDLVFQSGPVSHISSAELTLGSFPMAWVVASGSVLAREHRLLKSDLENQPILTHAKNTVAFKELQSHFQTLNINSARLVPSSNLLVARQMVVDGYGVGVLLRPLVDNMIDEGVLTELNYAWQPNDLPFYARYDKNRASNKVVQAARIAQKISLSFAQRYSGKKR